jgi:large subunit ribosomal protein L9
LFFMKVILLKDTTKIGKKGDLADVSDGYAQNFLIPKGFAAIATTQIQQKIHKEQRDAQEKSQRDLQKAESLKTDLEKLTFSVKVKVGDKGQIFGGVREKDIADAIKAKMNLDIDKHQLIIDQPLRSAGEHAVTLNLGHQIKARVKINVEALP